jgi:hypothetical protein
MATYFVEITDTFGGEANYSWVTRHKVRASSPRGAMIRVNRDSGLGFRRTADYGDSLRYDSRSGATCAFVSEWDDAAHGGYMLVNEL